MKGEEGGGRGWGGETVGNGGERDSGVGRGAKYHNNGKLDGGGEGKGGKRETRERERENRGTFMRA